MQQDSKQPQHLVVNILVQTGAQAGMGQWTELHDVCLEGFEGVKLLIESI